MTAIGVGDAALPGAAAHIVQTAARSTTTAIAAPRNALGLIVIGDPIRSSRLDRAQPARSEGGIGGRFREALIACNLPVAAAPSSPWTSRVSTIRRIQRRAGSSTR